MNRGIVFSLIAIFMLADAAFGQSGWIERDNCLEQKLATGAMIYLNYSPDGSYIYSSDRFSFKKWDPKTGVLVKELKPGFEYISFAISSDEKRAYFVQANYRKKTSFDCQIWDAQNDTLIKAFVIPNSVDDHGGSEGVRIILSKDNNYLYAGTSDELLGGRSLTKCGIFYFIDAIAGTIISSKSLHDMGIWNMKISPNNKYLALNGRYYYEFANFDHTITVVEHYYKILFDMENFKFSTEMNLLMPDVQENESMYCYDFSKDNKYFAYIRSNGKISLVDLHNFTKNDSDFDLKSGPWQCAFSNDNQYLIVSMWDSPYIEDRIIYLYHLPTKRIVSKLSYRYSGYAGYIAVSPDSVSFATGGDDGILRVFKPRVFSKEFKCDFTSDSTSINVDSKVHFYNYTTGKPTEYFWDFGDGTVHYAANPWHIYTKPGYYTVKLIASDGIHTDTVIKKNYIRVTEYLKADFDADNRSGTGNLEVHFIDKSIGKPISWLWDFGDGETSTEQNPVHIYNKETNQYTVKLTIKSISLSSTEEKQDFIFNLNSNFSCDVTTGEVPFRPDFNYNYFKAVPEKIWDYGDKMANETFAYEKPGIYTVKLIVKCNGLIDSTIKTDLIKVLPKHGYDVKWYHRANKFYINKILFSKDRKKLFSAGDDGLIVIWDSYTGKILDSITLGMNIVDFCMNNDEDTIYSLMSYDSSGYYGIYNLKNDSLIIRTKIKFPDGFNEFYKGSIKLSPDNNFIMTNITFKNLCDYNPPTYSYIGSSDYFNRNDGKHLKNNNLLTDYVISPENKYSFQQIYIKLNEMKIKYLDKIYTTQLLHRVYLKEESTGTLFLIDTSSYMAVEKNNYEYTAFDAYKLFKFSADGKRYAIFPGGGSIIVDDFPYNSSEFKQIDLPIMPDNFEFSLGDMNKIIGGGVNSIFLFDLLSDSLINNIVYPRGYVNWKIALSPDRRLIAAANDLFGVIRVFTLDGISPVQNIIKDEIKINVFPNPFSDNIYINFIAPEDAKVSIDIYNLSSIKLLERNLVTIDDQYHSELIDATSLMTGIYLLRVNIGDKMYVKKIIHIK